MEDLEMSAEEEYAMTVFENISIIAYVSSFLIFGIFSFIFHDFNELAMKVSGIFFIIGLVSAATSSFILCGQPVVVHLQEKDKKFTEEEMKEVKALLDEFDVLDEKEKEKNQK